MHPSQTQEQPKTAHSFHHFTTPVPREEVPAEAVPVHRGACRVLRLAQSHGDAGQNLVSEPTSEGQAASRSRAREVEDGGPADSSVHARTQLPVGVGGFLRVGGGHVATASPPRHAASHAAAAVRTFPRDASADGTRTHSPSLTVGCGTRCIKTRMVHSGVDMTDHGGIIKSFIVPHWTDR